MEWGSINGEFVARKKKFSKTSTAGGTDDKCLFNRSVISIYPRVTCFLCSSLQPNKIQWIKIVFIFFLLTSCKAC